jgi:tripartite-type tricarboxylate transporter receptor subunit TctC
MLRILSILIFLAVPFSVKAEITSVPVVITFSAGGATDQLWRIVEPHLNKKLESSKIRLVTENVPGAGGTIGTNKVATNDKPMLGFFSPAFAIAPNTITESVRYSVNDFRLIGYAGETKMFMISTIENLEKFKTECSKRKIFYGSSGIGSTSHLLGTIVGEHFKCKELVHVPYKGISQSYPDLFSGRIDYVVDYAISTKNLIKANKVVEIVEVDERFPIYIESWHMFVANKNVDDKLFSEIKRAFDDIKRDKDIVQDIESKMQLKNFKDQKDDSWMKKQFDIYKKFISKVEMK